jgi:hypothetical protein
MGPFRFVYYVADDRESSMQRSSLAQEIARVLPGFDQVSYPDWESLFSRWWREAQPGMILALDEFSAAVVRAPEIPSILQKQIDRAAHRGPHLILAGSSQRMMQGLVLDRSAPLYGRAGEILKIAPLPCGWIRKALRIGDPVRAVESYAVWGGVPRYWELAADFTDLQSAVESLVLSPLGVLHQEPTRLLLDDLREIAQAASLLTLIGQGCHRVSEMAGRLGKPATALSRPLQRLLELDLIRRDFPFGASSRDSKRTLYRIADPFLRFWFRYVEPNRSLLAAGQISAVRRNLADTSPQHVAGIWEDLVRQSIPRAGYFGRRWKVAAPWWGTGWNKKHMEIDVVAESEDGASLLLGEAKWAAGSVGDAALQALRQKAQQLPLVGERKVLLGLWLKSLPARGASPIDIFTPQDVLQVLQ